MKNSMITGWSLKVAVAALSLAVCGGCESENTDTDITATRFYVDRDLRNYSSTDEFEWETTLNQAVTTVRINNFTKGDTSLRVYDGSGKRVQAAFLNTIDNVYYVDRSLFFQRQTDAGVAGTWRIVLAYRDFSGDISITLE